MTCVTQAPIFPRTYFSAVIYFQKGLSVTPKLYLILQVVYSDEILGRDRYRKLQKALYF